MCTESHSGQLRLIQGVMTHNKQSSTGFGVRFDHMQHLLLVIKQDAHVDRDSYRLVNTAAHGL
jgi:hypothetical protein